MIPVHCTDWDLLGMHWQGQYYVDTCFQFGLHLSPFLHNEYTTTIEWFMTHDYQLRYLLKIFSWLPLCNPFAASAILMHFSIKLGVPVGMEKVEGLLTAKSFLGLILDSVKQEIPLPPETLAELVHELNRWSNRHKATKRELFSLIGKLSFVARASCLVPRPMTIVFSLKTRHELCTCVQN